MKQDIFENIIKEKLNAFEYKFNSEAWKDFQNKIPNKKSYNFYTQRIITPVLIAVVSTLALLHFYSVHESSQKISQNTYSPPNFLTNHNIRKVQENNTSIENQKYLFKKKLNDNSNLHNDISNNNVDVKINNPVPVKHVNDSLKRITNNINTQLPNSNYSISKTEGCQPLVVNFIPNEISDSVIYLWDFGDGNFSNKKTPYHTYTSNKTYITKLTVKYHHSEKIISSDIHEIKVNKKPYVDFKWEFIEEDVKFINLSDPSNNIKWQFDEFNVSSKEFEPEYTFKKNGVHLVTLCLSNEFGCINSISKPINIEIKHKIFMPDAFIPDNNGRNELFGAKTCIEIKEFNMNIFDMYGNIVFQSNNITKHWNGKINGTEKNAKTGRYFWEYTLKDEYNNIIYDKGRVMLKR